MNTAIESWATLHYNPFVLSPLLEAFYEQTVSLPKNVLLAYLVLPLALFPKSRSFLRNVKSTSSLTTFCRDASRLYGLSERIYEYRTLTNNCLQFSIDSKSIYLKDDLSIEFFAKMLDSSACPDGAVKAAEGLGKLFHPYDVPTVYRSLGVNKL